MSTPDAPPAASAAPAATPAVEAASSSAPPPPRPPRETAAAARRRAAQAGPRRAPFSSGAPPTSGQFFRFGLPFLLFAVIGTWGFSKLLQPKYDRSGGASGLYGRSTVDPAANGQKGEKAAPRKLLTLEEEFAKAQKEFQAEFDLKPVPRPPTGGPQTR